MRIQPINGPANAMFTGALGDPSERCRLRAMITIGELYRWVAVGFARARCGFVKFTCSAPVWVASTVGIIRIWKRQLLADFPRRLFNLTTSFSAFHWDIGYVFEMPQLQRLQFCGSIARRQLRGPSGL